MSVLVTLVKLYCIVGNFCGLLSGAAKICPPPNFAEKTSKFTKFKSFPLYVLDVISLLCLIAPMPFELRKLQTKCSG